MGIQLLKIRLKGFATNSSSSHSVILAGSMKEPNSGPALYGEFGWGFFLQSSHQDKMAYMARALYDCMAGYDATRSQVSRAKKIVKDLLGVECGLGNGIDHQSAIEIPRYANKKLAFDFWKELSIAISRDPTVEIAGGSDGDDIGAEDHPFWSVVRNALNSYNSDYRIRKDGDVWVLFNTHGGQKIHLGLGDTKFVDDFKPTRPELVDLKITDKCTIGCDFCYQGSSPRGKHAKYEDIEKVLEGMAKAEVFEIAIGGGEPTLHPQFFKILNKIRELGMVPNFSTKNYDFFTPSHIERFRNIVGAIGISVSTIDDLKRYMEIMKAAQSREINNDWGSTKIMMHYILDQYPMSNFIAILERISKTNMFHHHLLLLGKKDGGRSTGGYLDSTGWALFVGKFFKDEGLEQLDVSVDTLIANRYGDDLRSIDKRQYYTEEGRFSVYVDVVNKKFGKASYGTELIPYIKVKDILNAFREWEPIKIL